MRSQAVVSLEESQRRLNHRGSWYTPCILCLQAVTIFSHAPGSHVTCAPLDVIFLALKNRNCFNIYFFAGVLNVSTTSSTRVLALTSNLSASICTFVYKIVLISSFVSMTSKHRRDMKVIKSFNISEVTAFQASFIAFLNRFRESVFTYLYTFCI